MDILITYLMDEKGITFATWALTFVTALDAKVGVRIYKRVNVLITTITTKVRPATPDEPETPKSRPAKTLNDGHNFRN